MTAIKTEVSTLPDQGAKNLANALREAVVGKSEAGRIAAARLVFAVLAGTRPQRDGNKRGPKREGWDWARARLIALAKSPDGLPDSQAKLINWLGNQFGESGVDVPSGSKLKRMVSEFYGWQAVLDEAAGIRYRASPDLQAAFESEEEYLQWKQLQDRLAQKFLHDAKLQKKFGTPDRYLAKLFGDHVARCRSQKEI